MIHISVTNVVGPQEEDVMIGQITRVQPLSEGEREHWGHDGCRIYLANAVSSVMVRETREEVWERIYSAMGGPLEHLDEPWVSVTQVIEVLAKTKAHAERAKELAVIVMGLSRKPTGGDAALPVFNRATADEIVEIERLLVELCRPLPEIQYGVDLTNENGDFSLSEVPITELWRHKKRQSLYGVLTMEGSVQGSIDEGDHVVIYVDQDGHFWVRDREMFLDGRFTKEEHS